MDNLDKKVDSIDSKQDALNKKMDDFIKEIRDGYVKNDDFLYWRNLFVSGLLIVIVGAILLRFLNIPLTK